MMARPLAEIEAACAGCTKCDLAATRNNLVFGVGNPHASVMFIGEAPGKNEDLKGEPFVGAAGKLLNEMLERVGISRDDIYIANICKCRPPKNRNPRTDEIEACTPWLHEQVASIHPTVIVTLGNFATRFVLNTTEGITGLRGRVHAAGPLRVIPMFLQSTTAPRSTRSPRTSTCSSPCLIAIATLTSMPRRINERVFVPQRGGDHGCRRRACGRSASG